MAILVRNLWREGGAAFWLAWAFVSGTLALNVLTDPVSRKLRLCAFLVAAVGGFSAPGMAVLAFLTSLCWFEVPLLRFGFPNQFITDVAMIGLMTGVSLRLSRQTPSSPDSRFGKDLANLHPFFFALVPVTLLAASYATVSFTELSSLSGVGINPWFAARALSREAFNWAIERDQFHNFSMIVAFTIQCLWIRFLFWRWDDLGLSPRKIFGSVVVGAVPVCLVALGQILAPQLIAPNLNGGVSGTLQNQNLLSYESGLALISLISLISVTPLLSPRQKNFRAVAIFVLFPLFAFGLFAGLGRLEWIAMMAIGMVAGIWNLIFLLRSPDRLQAVLRRTIPITAAVIVCLVMIVLVVSFYPSKFPYQGKLTELIAIFSDFSFERLFFAGGRGPHMKKALEFFGDYTLFGIGLDSFFVRGGQSYEVHNWILKWLVGLGIPAVAVLVGAVVVTGTIIGSATMKSKDRLTAGLPAAIAALAFMGICILGDTTLSYRNLLTQAASVVAILVTMAWPPSKLVRLSAQWSLIALCVGAVVWGQYSRIRPQTWPRVVQAYAEERRSDAAVSFNWQALATVFNVPDRLQNVAWCLTFDAKGIAMDPTEITVAPLTSDVVHPQSHWMASDLGAFEGRVRDLGVSLTGVKIAGRDLWSPVCLCHDGSARNVNGVYLRGANAVIPAITRGFGQLDTRLLSFATSKVELLPVAKSVTTEGSTQQLVAGCQNL